MNKIQLPGCSICSLEFSIIGFHPAKAFRVPFVLQCGHSACENCLMEGLKTRNKILCMTCQKYSTIPADLTESQKRQHFPINYYLCGLWFHQKDPVPFNGDSHLAFAQTKKEYTFKPKTVSCNECSAIATLHCNQCSAPYCVSCFNKVHATAKALKGHVRVLLAQASSSKLEILNICLEHQENYQFHCGQCNVPACNRCFRFKHNGHSDMLLLSEKNEELRDELLDHYIQVANIHSRLKNADKVAKRMMTANALSDPLNHAVQEIQEHFISLHGHLMLLQNNLLMQLKQSDLSSSLDEIRRMISTNIEDLNDVLKVTKFALDGQSSTDFSLHIQLLKQKFNTPCFFNEASDTNKKTFTFNKNIYEILDNHCKISLNLRPLCTLLAENELPEHYEKEILPDMTVHDIDQLLNDSVIDTSYNSITASQTSLNSTSSSIDLSHLVPPDDLIPGISIRATVSHLVSPSEFYIHRTGTQKKLDELHQSLKKMIRNNHAKQSPKILVGSMYLVLYKDNMRWVRGRAVKLINDDEATVQFIDYGFKDTVQKDRLREYPSNSSNIPGLALRCKLADCVPRQGNEWDFEAVALMVKIIGKNPVEISIVANTPLFYEVSMFVVNGSLYTNIKTSLCFLGYSAFVRTKSEKSGPSIPKSPLRYFPNLPISDGEILEIKITHINNPHDFYVIIHSDCLGKYVSMFDRLDKMYSNKNASNKYCVYHPLEGLPVAAKSEDDKKWHRAYIVDATSPKLIQVFFIDWGSTETINWKNVKQLHESFMNMRPQAYRCRLVDVDPVDATWTKEANILLESKIESRLKVYLQNTIDDTLNVILYELNMDGDICINALLVRNEMATSTGINSTIVDFPKMFDIAPDILQTVQCDIKTETELEENSYKIPNLLDEKFYSLAKDGCMRIRIDIKKIVNPGEFYITVSYLEEAYKQMENVLQNICAQLPENASNMIQWNTNDKCAVLLGNKWWRGFILEVLEDGKVHVYFPDYAEKHIVSISTIRPLPNDFATIRDAIIRCHLGGLLPAQNVWSGISVTEFQEFVDDKNGTLYMTKMHNMTEEQSLPIELYAKVSLPVDALEPRKDIWNCFNQYMRVKGYAKSDGITQWSADGNIIKTEAQRLISIRMQAEIHDQLRTMLLSKPEIPTMIINLPKWLPYGKFSSLEFVALPTFVSEDGIYVQDYIQNTGKVGEITQKILMEYNKLPPLLTDINWTPGQMCSVRYFLDRKWYRGEIITIGEKNILVKFIDFGNSEYVSPDFVREPMFTDVPVQANLCKFNRIKPINEKWEDNQICAIQEILVDKFCRIKLVILSDGSYGIDQLNLPDGKCALTEIVHKKLAKFFETIVEEEEEEEEFLTPTEDEVYTEPFDFTQLGYLRQMFNIKSIEIPNHIHSVIADYSAVLTPTFVSLSLANNLEETKSFFEEFNQLTITIKNEAHLLPNLEPPYLHKACCVLFQGDGNWYRGFVIKELPNNKVHIQYADYGIIEVFNINNVFQAKKEWLKVKTPGVLAVLDSLIYNPDSGINSEKLMNELFKCLTRPSSEIIIKSRLGPYLNVDIVNHETKTLLYQELIDKKYYIRRYPA